MTNHIAAILLFTLANLMLVASVVAKSVAQFSASSTELTFTSNGQRMSGLIYQAAGQGKHPTAVLLHGYPGNEKNLDVAQALRSKGWNVVFFHYRGSWGSEGEFSFINAEQDVQAVMAYLNDAKNADKLRINRQFISLIGHSMGGHMAIAGLLDNPSVKCAIAYDGANLGVNDVGIMADPETTIPWQAYSDSLFMLNGWSGEKLQQHLTQHAKALNLVNRVNTVNGRPVLLIAADTEVIPMKSHILPLLAALKGTKNSAVSYQLIKDDHSFNNSRSELIAATYEFLKSRCFTQN